MSIEKIINIGILAHVDAGKTTVTENLLYHGHVIDKIGRVDNGDTQTDSMELERKRGITIKASAVSFDHKGVKINILDTPGHLDFIAEVERSLSILDGAILVISAAEGVQSQTKVLFDALKKLNIPTIIFINKLDRLGADLKKAFGEIQRFLSKKAVVLQTCANQGEKSVSIQDDYNDEILMNNLIDVLADIDDEILCDYLEKGFVDKKILEQKICYYSSNGKIYPVFMGAAGLNVGTDLLLDKIIRYLPISDSNACKDDEISGVVFKIEKLQSNEKKAYVRMFSGEINIRDIISIDGEIHEKIKKISVLENGHIIDGKVISCCDIGIIHGISCIKAGSILGIKSEKLKHVQIARPTLKTRILPENSNYRHSLHLALTDLSEEDPLLELETDIINNDIYINLFGEVQKEVISSILKSKYGLNIEFSNTQTIYKETVLKEASASMNQGEKLNIFYATVKIKVEPLALGDGIKYHSDVTAGFLPKSFLNAIEEAVYDTLKYGMYGWELTDIKVTLTNTEYDSVMSTPSDFRNLTPMVLAEAIHNAGTKLLEPINEFELRVPLYALNRAVFDLKMMRASFENPQINESECMFYGLIPADSSKDYQIKVASYTEGKGIFISRFSGYEDTSFDESKICRRNIINPLNKKEYIMYKLNAIKR